ncbi:protein CFAP276 [Condylostylus longicornis]|uniref:protein CFAP276 n=1 Tax=Condylostylus longicornis TaxID=2530218 RepID=UPI00244E16B0|nr:protein CFAP276 [Condylostylus longicornis]
MSHNGEMLLVEEYRNPRIRNLEYLPILDSEGFFTKKLPEPPKRCKENCKFWYDGLQPYERLYYHQTLNAVRKSARFRQSKLIPKDTLDFILQSNYNHSKETFPCKTDVYLQNETMGKKTFRVLRNQREIYVEPETILGHPIQIGGLKDKISPHSVKLIHSGHHSQMTNKGYSRQSGDGNIFHY